MHNYYTSFKVNANCYCTLIHLVLHGLGANKLHHAYYLVKVFCTVYKYKK